MLASFHYHPTDCNRRADSHIWDRIYLPQFVYWSVSSLARSVGLNFIIIIDEITNTNNAPATAYKDATATVSRSHDLLLNHLKPSI